MPTRTLVQELCDVCFSEDETETEATDRLRFGWQGRDYVLLVCESHVDDVRDQLQHLSEVASPEGATRRRAAAPSAPRAPRSAAQPAERASKTLFSQLSDEEKARFREWADMPNARRIADSRVRDWVAAGKP